MPATIRTFREQLELNRVIVQERRGSGRIGDAIGIEAISRHHDLVVLGASGRGMVKRVLSGNPAGIVMAHPPCTTILFRPGLEPL